MRIVVNEFMSLDGVVQAPGGAEEDTDGGFAHGGWSAPYFDPQVMGAAIGEGMNTADALLFGRRTWQGMAAAWPGARRRPLRRPDERDQEVRGVPDADARRPDVEQHDLAVARPRGRGRRRAARAGGSRRGDVGERQPRPGLLAEGLVDELNLMIEPILLGGGKRIFPDDGMRPAARSCQQRDGEHRRAGLHVPTRGLSPEPARVPAATAVLSSAARRRSGGPPGAPRRAGRPSACRAAVR